MLAPISSSDEGRRLVDLVDPVAEQEMGVAAPAVLRRRVRIVAGK